jgi:hypothetical protein
MGTSEILFCSNFFYDFKGSDMDRAIVGTTATPHATAEASLDIGLIIVKELVFMPSFQP